MKDIYLNMNSQNILRFYGSKLDVKLDSSEFYDYELSKVFDDHNTDVLDLTTPITYSALTINTTLADFSCVRDTITLTEYDNTANDSNYVYSGFTTTLPYLEFVNHISTYHKHVILNNDVYFFNGENDNVHYMQITGFNDDLDPNLNMGVDEADIINKFDTEYLKCTDKLDVETACCGFTEKLNNKPWAYQFQQPEANTCVSPLIKRRTEKGWSLDFIFNRYELDWSFGNIFYFLGTRGSTSVSEFADSNLSFGFTNDGRIKWEAIRYSGYCGTTGYTESFYLDSDETVPLCTTELNKDFNITIVFDRYKHFTDCDIENHGSWNDMLGWRIDEYTDTVVTAVTSTQITSYEENIEELSKKWADEKQRRLGTLKIYLNGRPIYKKENWEEIIPSNKGIQPFIQSWGGGTGLMAGEHDGVCCFNIKSIKYYEEPLDFVHVNHNFRTRIDDYDFDICGVDCQDELFGYYGNALLTETGEYIMSEDGNVIIY